MISFNKKTAFLMIASNLCLYLAMEFTFSRQQNETVLIALALDFYPDKGETELPVKILDSFGNLITNQAVLLINDFNQEYGLVEVPSFVVSKLIKSQGNDFRVRPLQEDRDDF
jgi:hypothetical protein